MQGRCRGGIGGRRASHVVRARAVLRVRARARVRARVRASLTLTVAHMGGAHKGRRCRREPAKLGQG